MAGTPSGFTDANRLERPRRVLMVSPDYFEVEYVINPHMEGHVGTVDRAAASVQWDAVRSAYSNLGFEVDVIPGRQGLPDMVFSANQTLPGILSDGTKQVVMSSMASEQRQPEVEHFEDFFRSQEYEPIRLNTGIRLEGCGDAIWHAGRRILWLGFGFRTDREAAEPLAEILETTVIPLELVSDEFYHLDTCLSILDEKTALWVPRAFSGSSAARICAVIPNLIETPADEASRLLACNAHTPDGKTILIQKGCPQTINLIRDAGFAVLELETGEFLKAGGSVFCMKQMFW